MESPIMADLPISRTDTQPFENSVADLAGTFQVKVCRTIHKRWIAIHRLARQCSSIWSDHVPLSLTSRFRTIFHMISELVPHFPGLEHQFLSVSDGFAFIE